MAIQNRCGVVVGERTNSSSGANGDVIVTEVRGRREKITRIVNIYNQRNTLSGERQARKLNRQRVIWHGGTVLAGEINAHSSWWDPRCRMQRNTALREEVIKENGLEVGIDGQRTHYRTRVHHEGESIIDLTLANRLIMKWFLLADNHATRCVQEVIEWEIEVDWQGETDHARVVRWNLAAMMEEDVEAVEKLWAELAKVRAHLDAECTEDKVEQEAAWCQEAMSSVLNATAMKIRICAKSKRWWNANFIERR